MKTGGPSPTEKNAALVSPLPPRKPNLNGKTKLEQNHEGVSQICRGGRGIKIEKHEQPKTGTKILYP
jgi:hypothetical protein